MSTFTFGTGKFFPILYNPTKKFTESLYSSLENVNINDIRTDETIIFSENLNLRYIHLTTIKNIDLLDEGIFKESLDMENCTFHFIKKNNQFFFKICSINDAVKDINDSLIKIDKLYYKISDVSNKNFICFSIIKGFMNQYIFKLCRSNSDIYKKLLNAFECICA